jgi:hypothetical protein
VYSTGHAVLAITTYVCFNGIPLCDIYVVYITFVVLARLPFWQEEDFIERYQHSRYDAGTENEATMVASASLTLPILLKLFTAYATVGGRLCTSLAHLLCKVFLGGLQGRHAERRLSPSTTVVP